MMMLAIEPAVRETTYNLGPNVTGTLYDDGKLVITGSGAMYNYDSSNTSPFLSNDTITSVIIYAGYHWESCVLWLLCPQTLYTIMVRPLGITLWLLCLDLSHHSPTVSKLGLCVYALTLRPSSNTVTTIGNYAFYGCTA